MVASNGWCDAGTLMVATATAGSGFTFTGWLMDGTNVTMNPLSLPASRSYTAFARFVVNTAETYAVHACSGYRSPGTGTVVTGSFSYPGGQVLTQLTWYPVLPEGWALVAAEGQGGVQVDATNLVFSGPFTNNPITFSCTLSVPGNEPVTNQIRAGVDFRFAGMAMARSVMVSPDPLIIGRYHSADYRAPFWTLDGTEINRVLAYWRAGAYHVDATGYDGYAPGAGSTNGGLHSADFQDSRWTIDETEAGTALAYWRAGHFVVNPGSADGYAAGAGGLPGPLAQDASPAVLSQSGPTLYDAGGVILLTSTFTYSRPLLSLSWRPSLPAGWDVVSVQGDGNPEYQHGAMLWTGELPPSPITMVYAVSVPWWESGRRVICNRASYYFAGMSAMAAQSASPESLTLQPRDSDADGLPDGWEQHYTGNSTGMSPNADDDDDGMNNLQECLAGTDAKDAASVLELTAVTRDANQETVLWWSSVTNRVYSIEKGTNLTMTWPWVVTNILATPPSNVFHDVSGNGNAFFYRVRVEP